MSESFAVFTFAVGLMFGAAFAFIAASFGVLSVLNRDEAERAKRNGEMSES